MMNSINNELSKSENSSEVKIKTEPGLTTPVRLPSFKQTRDLMLNNSNSIKQPPKKVFTPNLNVTRNKTKGPIISDNRDRRKNDRSNGRDRTRHNQNKGPNVVKAGGVFSEGIAASTNRRYSTRENYSSREPSNGLEKPVFKSRTPRKFDKEFEDLQIKQSLSDDEEDSDSPLDNHFLPIRLPMNSERGLFYKLDDNVKPTIKKEPVIKSEPPDDKMILNEERKPVICAVESKPIDLNNTFNFFQNPKTSLIMVQFPDSLPGRGPDKDTREQKDKTEEVETDRTENICKFDHLEEGQIGKILVYKSGRTKMKIGETFYDLALGSQTCFKQDVMSISANSEERTGRMINLGSVHSKIMAIPDWEQIIKKPDTS